MRTASGGPAAGARRGRRGIPVRPALVLALAMAWGAWPAARAAVPQSGRAAVPAPAPEAAPISRIAFGSCIGQDLPQPIWDHVLAAKPDLFVFLGDNVYADTADMGALRAAYAKLEAQPGFRRLRESTRILATWDDHDYGTDNSGRDHPARAASQQVFLDFWQVPKDSPRRRRQGIYHAEVSGPPGRRVQVILLDTRYHRSPLEWRKDAAGSEGRYAVNESPEATLLGAAQWAWLEEQLRVPAQVRILASSVQVVAEDHGGEKWANFPLERKRLFELIWNTRVTGLFFISGDRHYAELSTMDGRVGFPVYDITASSMNWSERFWRPLGPNRHRVATMNVGDNFGLVEIDWERSDPMLHFQIRDDEGAIRIHHKFPLSVLRDGTIPWQDG